MGAGHAHSTPQTRRSRLVLVFFLTLAYLVVEVVGGLYTGSLALLADAGHMLTDVAGLGLALFAMKLSERPASSKHSYGLYRAEILAAVVNAVILLGISFYVLYEAYQRFQNPPPVAGLPILAVAVVGLGVNVAGLFLLRGHASGNLNVKGAYFEVLSDALTSIGVIIAAVIVWTTGWYLADPLVSAGIGLFILPRMWALLKEGTRVLLEGTPIGIDVAQVRAVLSSVRGVKGVHDLHVWSLSSGKNALSAHVVMEPGLPNNQLLETLHRKVRETFAIEHLTVQLEHEGLEENEVHI